MNARTRKAVRAQLLEEDPRCIWCGHFFDDIPVASSREHMPTIEHILPRAQGGTDEMSNLAIACHRCNDGMQWRTMI